MDLPTRPVVVLTREPEDNRSLMEALSQRRVPVREIPCMAVRYIEPVDLSSDTGFQAIVFTSRRGVQGLFRTHLSTLPAGCEPAPMICSVGEATAQTLTEYGIHSDLIADPPRAEVLAKLLVEKLQVPCRIALVCGNLTTGKMEKILADAGFDPVKMVVYENYAPDIPSVSPFPIAAIFVASPSAGRRLIEINPWMRTCTFFTIGETTAAALTEVGVTSVHSAGPDPDDWIEVLHTAYKKAWNDR